MESTVMIMLVVVNVKVVWKRGSMIMDKSDWEDWEEQIWLDWIDRRQLATSIRTGAGWRK